MPRPAPPASLERRFNPGDRRRWNRGDDRESRALYLPRMSLSTRTSWIFDLDGTLTVAAHDFDEIARILGVEPGTPILENLRAMEPARAKPLWDKLHAWELEVAARSRPAPHARELLEDLAARGHSFGILTRNAWENVDVTLRAAGLLEFFPRDVVVTRDDAAFKPSPDGIHRLLDRFAAKPEHGVMVGDFIYDLKAGKAARVLTVHYDVSGAFEWKDHADLHVRCHSELRARLTP